jgi:deferrochelatase/peroxidase EfeB
MPKFANDYLVRPERSHGDLSIVVNADHTEAVTHAFRQIMRQTRGDFVPRWMKEGFNHVLGDHRPGTAPARNLLGFKDGTSNPDPGDEQAMDTIVWVQPDDGQPAWAEGGTYQAIRVIRMMVEFWDRTRLNEQEGLIGRHRASGAPLGMEDETDQPDFDNLDSHIARANPRTAGSEQNLILRRGFNYASGFDENDQLDQGLIFSSYQRSLENGFIAVQRRLDGEALEEYIRPLGGGFFFVPPPPAEGVALGEALLA